ncbi:MAG: Clp protease N-terminal domain-containing protein [Actinomycetota bacterium]
MSNFLKSAATMQSLSLAGMEEASRHGQRIGDIEHLLLALTISDQSAGHVLRGLGVTLDRAREAIEEERAAQLRGLGVSIDSPRGERIVFHETEGYEWSDRVTRLLQRAGERDKKGDASAVLRELLDEPSGLIPRIFQRLGVPLEDVRERLDEADRLPLPSGRRVRVTRDHVVGRVESFVPAPIDDVWALLADPRRMPEWDPVTGSIELEDDAPNEPGRSWTGLAIIERPDGRRAGIKEQFERRRITLLTLEEPTRIGWRFTHPDAPRSNTNDLTIELSPAAAGTQLVLTSTWNRRRGWRRIIAWPLRPFQRFLFWISLTQIGGGIGRVFR